MDHDGSADVDECISQEIAGSHVFLYSTFQSYNGRNMHVQGPDVCMVYRDGYGSEVKVEACSTCHTKVVSEEDLESIRLTEGDFDCVGGETEGIASEIETIHDTISSSRTWRIILLN